MGVQINGNQNDQKISQPWKKLSHQLIDSGKDLCKKIIICEFRKSFDSLGIIFEARMKGGALSPHYFECIDACIHNAND